jgi:hypothetical protein
MARNNYRTIIYLSDLPDILARNTLSICASFPVP